MDFTPEGFKRDWETRLAEAQLRLAREKEKPEPDAIRIEVYENDAKFAKSVLEKHERQMQEYASPEEKLKDELAAFGSLLSAKGKLPESEIKEKIRFKDKTWAAIFFALLEKRMDLRVKRKLFFFGERVFEKAQQ